HRLAPVIVEAVEPISVSHAFRHRKIDSRIADHDSMRSRRKSHRALQVNWVAIGRNRQNVNESRNRTSSHPSGINHRNTAIEGERYTPQPVGDYRAIALDAFRALQSISDPVLVQIFLTH